MSPSVFRCARARQSPLIATLLLALGLGLSSGQAGEADGLDRELLREKRAWLEEVAQGDHFFWERFFFRLDNAGEFPMPQDWYRPSELVVGAVSSPIPIRGAAERNLSDAAVAQIRDYLLPRKTGALYVAHGGKIDYQMFGEGFHDGSLVAIRSITKWLVGLLTGIAIGEGDIGGLDDPIGKYLDEWAGDPRGAITIRQLLQMASGLEVLRMSVDPNNKLFRLAEGSDVNATALSYDMIRPAGKSFGLAQVDTQLLAMIIERVSGMRLADYMSVKLWRPMGLGTATLNLDQKNGNARAFCCMRARSIDVVKIGMMLVNDGVWQGQRILPEGWVKQMVTPSPTDDHIGLHVFLGWAPGQKRPSTSLPHSEPFLVDDLFYFVGGLSIKLWMIPSQNIVIFRWGDDPEDWDASKIPNIVLDDLMNE